MPHTIKYFLLWAGSCFFLFFSSEARQLKLGNHPASHTQSAVLELESPNQGLLMTRVADTSLINAFSPPDGTLIYFTDGRETEPYGEHAGLYQRIDGAWTSVMTAVDTAVSKEQTAIKFTREDGKLVLHLPNATSGLRGVMSGGRQSFSGRKTFNDSVRIKNLHPGSVIFIRDDKEVDQVLTENNGQFFWDEENKRLGLGTNAPSATLDVDGTMKLGMEGTIVHAIISHTFTTTASISVGGGGNKLITVPVPGVASGGSVKVSPAGPMVDGLIIAYGYTTPGEVHFKIENAGSSTANIPKGTAFYIAIIQ